MLKIEIKEILKLLRKKRKLTQAQIAEKINLTREAYAQYETGKNLPPTQTVLILSSFYGVTTDYILGRYKDEEYK